ncbi:MAG: PD-(D/E)XK nuclease family protein [Planctomycetota bacterium]
MSSASNRVFLGSGPRPLARAAEWLLDSIDDSLALGDTLVCVPGARAGRTLLALLADAVRERGVAGFLPPRVMTVGRLVDELVRPARPVADRLTRTVAWERALREAPGGEFARIRAFRPAEEDRGAWWTLADQVRAAHAELAVLGLDFAAVAARVRSGAALAPEGETRRFDALGRVQQRWRELLDGIGLVDPHEGRRAALEADGLQADARVVLVGVVDLNPLARAALERLAVPPTPLVLADASLRGAFDDLGGIVPDERWTARPLDLPLNRWRVVHGPDEQARMALAVLGEGVEGGAFERADEVVVGVPEPEVVPYLVRRFGARGITAREAAGVPLGRTQPARLLDALARFLDGRSFSALAELVRHADLEECLARGGEARALERLDAYRATHLPRAAERPIADDLAAGALPSADIARLARALDGLMGGLARADARPLPRVVEDVAQFLDAVYRGSEPLRAEDEAGRVLRASLAAIESAVQDVATLPAPVAGRATARGAIELVLRAAAAGGAVPPPPAVEGEPTVELVGWLDLALDPAPHVVVTGFNEGTVPSQGVDDPLLTPVLREALGLVTDDARFAFDAYTLHLLLDTSESLTLVSGRAKRDGTPLFPSRLAFASSTDEAPARVDHALRPERFAPAEGRPGGAPPEPPSFVVPGAPTGEFTVTSFREFIDSPALFHVHKELRLRAAEDAVDEMDALVFGTLAHEVLERFGASELTASPDAAAIEAFVLDQLDDVARRRLPRSALSIARLQIEQLRLRLRSFAEVQATEAEKGWRVEHVEWEPSTEAPSGKRGVLLPMEDGEPDAWIIGKVDRIDRSAGGELRILDYKTSAKASKVRTAHLKRGKKSDAITADSWKDLQLPLYVLLASELGAASPRVGYFNLPGDGKPAAVDEVLWTPEEIGTALARARSIVRALRAEDSGARRAEVGRIGWLAPIEEELLGVGLVVAPATGADEAEAGEGDA